MRPALTIAKVDSVYVATDAEGNEVDRDVDFAALWNRSIPAMRGATIAFTGEPIVEVYPFPRRRWKDRARWMARRFPTWGS